MIEGKNSKQGFWNESPIHSKLFGWSFLQDKILQELVGVTSSIGGLYFLSFGMLCLLILFLYL